jgi:formylglycine-generating enzyme required for sulfatase activity
VTGSELGYFLTETVTNYSEGAQTPQYGKIRHRRLDKGDFVFEVRAEPPSAPTAVWRGHLQVNVNAPVQVRIGGERAGEAAPGRPLNYRNLPVGPVEVLVEAEGYAPARRSAEVRQGTWTQLVFQLVPEAPPGVALPGVRPIDPETEEAALALTRAQRRRLQGALNERGFDAGPADGVLGPRSRQALAAYQRSEGLEASGYLTAVQWAALQERMAKPSSRGSDVEPEMVAISGGCFQMGSPVAEKDRDDNERLHRVCVRDFRIARHQVTTGEFRAFVEATHYRTEAEAADGCSYFDRRRNAWKRDPSKTWLAAGLDQGEGYPVVCVSWNDAQAFVAWLNHQMAGGFRLPTEAEWEYAARGGTQTSRYWGDDPYRACEYGNVADRILLGTYPGWTIHDCRDGHVHTAPVGTKRPNPYGLHDMLGNVWEWTCSVYDNGYGGRETRCASDRRGGRRVLRGGSWAGSPEAIRAARRISAPPAYRSNSVGFRLAQEEPE